jgi:hypothetical protein
MKGSPVRVPASAPGFAGPISRAGHATIGTRENVEALGFAVRRRRVFWGVCVLVAGGTVGTALAYQYLERPPGFPGGISSLRDLPTAEVPASIPPIAVDNAASYVGLPADDARARMRRIGRGSQGDLYAFQGDDGSVCLFLARRLGTCLRADHFTRLRVPGVFATVSPGYPDEEPVLVGLVADDVKRVWTVVDGVSRLITIDNNAIYAPIPKGESNPISVEVEYDDGRRKLIEVHPGGD